MDIKNEQINEENDGISVKSTWVEVTKQQDVYIDFENVTIKSAVDIKKEEEEEEECHTLKNSQNEVTCDHKCLGIQKFESDGCSNSEELTQVAVEGQPFNFNQAFKNSIQNEPLNSSDALEIEEFDVKQELVVNRVVVVINLERMEFYQKNFVCSVCMGVFGSISLLHMHQNDAIKFELCFKRRKCMRIVEKNGHFKCGYCDYKSRWRSTVLNHEISHASDRPFKCEHCEYTSARRNSLKEHILIHSIEKPFHCDKCDFKSSWRSAVKQHKLTHLIKKPFQCDLCEFKSVRKSTVVLHKLSHTGEKPFKCDQCDYGTAWKSTLKRHRLMHCSEKPFACDKCDFKSAWRTALKIHKMSHT